MKSSPVFAVAGLALALGACDNMANQPKRTGFTVPFGSQSNWPPLPPAGTVPRDEKRVPPPALTMALLERGQQRYNIYCSPCHGRAGDGHGMIVQRGFPSPPPYYNEKLRNAPTQHFYDVITNGYGVMYPYAARVAPEDRWAITAYIRVLQASETTNLAEVPADKLQSLQ